MSLGIQITLRWHRLCPRRRRRIRVRKTTRILRCAGVVYGRPRAVFVFVACVASARGFMSRLCRLLSRRLASACGVHTCGTKGEVSPRLSLTRKSHPSVPHLCCTLATPSATPPLAAPLRRGRRCGFMRCLRRLTARGVR